MKFILMTRYHVASLFLLGTITGMALMTCQPSEPPNTAVQCHETLLEPFLHRPACGVQLGELHQLVINLQACSRQGTLFVERSDLFGIGAYPGLDGGIYREPLP